MSRDSHKRGGTIIFDHRTVSILLVVLGVEFKCSGPQPSRASTIHLILSLHFPIQASSLSDSIAHGQARYTPLSFVSSTYVGFIAGHWLVCECPETQGAADLSLGHSVN
jgi:hypothetical protein